MPLDYLSAYAPMQSNAQYGQPTVMGQGQQDAMHQAMLQQQNQYNNQSAQIAGQPSGLGSLAGGAMRGMMLAQALRQGDPKAVSYGGTPQSGYAQQGQYMQDTMNNPMTQQQMNLMNQGGPEFMSFNNPMPSGG